MNNWGLNSQAAQATCQSAVMCPPNLALGSVVRIADKSGCPREFIVNAILPTEGKALMSLVRKL
jgi:hypothetical protein